MGAKTVSKTGGIGKGTPGPGRGKGTPNKVTYEVKTMVTEALQRAGGVEYLVERANDPRTASAFLTLVGKVMPMQVHGAGPGGEHVFQKIVVEVVKASE